MSTNFILSTLLLVGAVQGIIMSVIIMLKKQDPQVRSYALVGFLLVLSYENFDTYLYAYLQQGVVIFDFFSFTIPHAAPACLYLYASSHWRQSWPRPLWHYFLPFLLLLTVRSGIVLMPVVEPSLEPANVLALDIYRVAFEPLLIVNLIAYMIKILIEYRQSKIEDHLKPWTSVFIWMISGANAVIVLLLAINWFSTDEFMLNVIFAIGVIVSFLIYWLAFFGYERTKTVFVESQRSEQFYWNSLQASEIDNCLQKIEFAFREQKCYRDQQLTLSRLAEQLGESPKLVSAVLNQKIGMGFNEYLNRFRVEEVKRNLTNTSKPHLSITGIGLDAGFNSIATFQRAFKQHTGQTPTEYLQKNHSQIMN